MSDMIERVARAICRAGICGPKDHLDEQENANWRKFVLEARAAIEAMRDETQAMRLAGIAEWSRDPKPEEISDSPSKAFSAVYRAMIDAALGKATT